MYNPFELIYQILGPDEFHRQQQEAMMNLKDATTIEVLAGDRVLDLAYQAATKAFVQTLNLRDLVQPGRKIEVIVSVIT